MDQTKPRELNYPIKKFYITFGQQHPLRDSWIEVEATSLTTALREAGAAFGFKYGQIYEEFNMVKEDFKGGKIGLTLQGE